MSEEREAPSKKVEMEDSFQLYLYAVQSTLKKIATSSIDWYNSIFNFDEDLQADYYYQKGIEYARGGRYTKAAGFLEIAAKEMPDDIEVLYFWGRSLIKIKEVEKGLEILEKGLKLDNSNLKILLQLADVYSELNEHEKIVTVLLKACNKKKRDANLHYKLGFAYDHLKDYDNAIKYFKKALAIDPNNATVCQALALTLESNGARDDAVEYFKKALELEENKKA